jgi:DNA-binding NtrC family response regulator
MSDQVLVIDNEYDVVESILQALRLRDITCRGETSPEKAIEDFRVDPTDVVIADYVFPSFTRVTGIDIIAKLQEIKPFTQFILISGRIKSEFDEEALSKELNEILKANRYLPKPIDIHKLVNITQEALESIEDQSSDWKKIAQNYVAKGQIDPSRVRELNERIKKHLIHAINNSED